MGCSRTYVAHIEERGAKDSTPQARRRAYDAIMAIAVRKRGGV